MTSEFGKFLKNKELMWRNIRTFAFNNRTIFESIFVIIYSIEQITLIALTYLYPKHIFLFVSFFAVLVLLTFALHKLLMESRIKVLEEMVADLNLEKEEIIVEAQGFHERYKEIKSAFEEFKAKSLNSLKSKNYKKRVK